MKNLATRLVCLFDVVLIMTVFFSCSIETYSTRRLAADNEIASFIKGEGYGVSADDTGLVYVQLLKGNGQYPEKGDKVAFHYVGTYLDGEKFDSSYDKSYPLIVELGCGQLIAGLEEALMKMDKGAKSKVVIPFYLAYGNMQNAPVPPYSNLVFELELLDIK